MQKFSSYHGYIAAIYAIIIDESEKKTEGLDRYYNGSAGASQHGHEISMTSITSLKSITALPLDA
ncbi:hypothetical protein FIU95_14120 [Microbulbifer sp. THAF38]|nr:hypothetical protein FIU95_14120 [Microbulbifer sp. THAF38]